MLSMIRSQLYRMVKSRFLIFYALVVFLIAFATPFAVWLHQVWPAFAASGFVELPDQPLPSLRIYGVSFVSGSFLAMGVGVAAAEYSAEDFKSGFMKNYVQARGGRVSYVLSMAVCLLILAVATTAFAMLVVEVTLRLQGYVAVAPAPLEALQWFAQVVLCVVAYALFALLLALATKSETVAVLGTIFLGGGAVESLLKIILANVPSLPIAVRDCLDGYLAVDLSQLGMGLVCDPMTYMQAAGTIFVVVAICVLVMRRRSLA